MTARVEEKMNQPCGICKNSGMHPEAVPVFHTMDSLATHVVWNHRWVEDLSVDANKIFGMCSVRFSQVLHGRPQYLVEVPEYVSYSQLKKLSRKGWFIGTVGPNNPKENKSSVRLWVGRKN